MKRLDVRVFGFSLLGALGCHSTAPTPDRPTQTAAVTPAAQENPGTRTRVKQPEVTADIVDRVYEIAISWDHDATAEQVQRSFGVALTPDGDRLVGRSSQWPVVVTFSPKAADKGALLQLAFTDVTGVSLAEIERRFGPPAERIEAKESLAAFASQSGARLVVSLLDGTKPSSLVSAIKLEGSGRKKPVPKDLF